MKIDRIIWIIMILLERKRHTAESKLYNSNTSCCYILFWRGRRVGIMENYKLEKRLFPTGDVTTLLMG